MCVVDDYQTAVLSLNGSIALLINILQHNILLPQQAFLQLFNKKLLAFTDSLNIQILFKCYLAKVLCHPVCYSDEDSLSLLPVS